MGFEDILGRIAAAIVIGTLALVGVAGGIWIASHLLGAARCG